MAPDQVIYFCWFGRSSRCASDYEVSDVEAQLCSLGQAHTLCQREPCYQHLGSILRDHPKGSSLCVSSTQPQSSAVNQTPVRCRDSIWLTQSPTHWMK